MAIKKPTIKLQTAAVKGANLAKETDEELSRMESEIRKLKIEYEQYFGGGKKKPPNDTEWRIEQIVKRYGDRGADMNYSQRFRYSTLSQTFAKYKEIFHKRARKREEGTVDRHYGAAARAIEAERERKRKAEAPPEREQERELAPEPPSSSRPHAERELPSVAIRCSDPSQEPKKVEQIYNAFRQALEHSGQSVEQLSPRSFEDFLKRKVDQLRKQKGGQDVEVVVSVEGGKAMLKARVKN